MAAFSFFFFAGVFSDWSGQFDALSGTGTISIYESVAGKRGKLLATEQVRNNEKHPHHNMIQGGQVSEEAAGD